MDIDRIFSTFSAHDVQYLLLGGMNFMLRHQPILTYDVDLWIEDTVPNRRATEQALAALDAEWGATDIDWSRVANKSAGWLDQQSIYCLTSAFGAIDIFRTVRGLENWAECWNRSIAEKTSGGVEYRGLSDADMLACQLALADGEQKRERIEALKASLQNKHDR